jgi:peroxiredoxin
LAEYGNAYPEFRRGGVELAAIAVDPAPASEAVRAQLRLPFPILCDTERRVTRDWGVLDSKDRRNIARPAVFLMDNGRRVVFRSLDSENKRVPAAGMLRLLRSAAAGAAVPRQAYWPRIHDWRRAIANIIRFGIRPRQG